MILVVGLLGVLLAPSLAFAQTGETDEEIVPVVADERLVPDLVVQIATGSDAEAELRSVADGLSRLAPIEWVVEDGTASPAPNLLLGLAEGREEAGLRAVTAFVDDHEAAERIAIGGRLADDAALQSRIGRTLVTVTLLMAVVIGGLVAWLIRPAHGALIGLSLVVSGLVASAVGSSGAVGFDGSMITTSLVAVLSGLLVAAYLALRLLDWFAAPDGEDLADMIRRSIASLGMELVMAGVSLVVAAAFLQIVGPGRSVAAPAFLGALVAVLLTLAVVATGLAALEGSGRRAVPPVFDERREAARTVFGTRPNGRDFPIAVILAFGFVFGFLALVAISSETAPNLVDAADRTDEAVVAVQERLDAGGGDPTVAVLARFPAGTDQLAKAAWLQRVSELPNVGRVDTTVNRTVAGETVELETSVLGPLSDLVDGDEAPTHALVVPLVSGRSDAAVDLVDGIRAVEGPVEAELSGVPVEAGVAGERDRSVVWVTIITLTLVAGVAVFGLTGDWTLAAIVAALRLLDAMALVGLYHLVVGAVSGPELLTVVMVVAVGSSLFEFGVLRQLLRGPASSSEDPLSNALDIEGWPAAVALAGLAIAGLGLVGTGVGPLSRFGVLLALALLVELIVGFWLLRPAVLGARAVNAAAIRTVRDALRSLAGVGVAQDDHARLHAAVSSLLLTEFQFQADPGVANMEDVFVPNTPLFRNAVDHHRNLAQAGLRITGRSPQLRDLQVVALEDQSTVNVTVDHPIRQLIDHSGKVVGVRKPERRTMMLWLDEGRWGHRIADSVELGAQALAAAPAPAAGQALSLSVE
ncbi:MAG: hypothetical protein AAF962_01035 [Actinomycetota bacterium]